MSTICRVAFPPPRISPPQSAGPMTRATNRPREAERLADAGARQSATSQDRSATIRKAVPAGRYTACGYPAKTSSRGPTRCGPPPQPTENSPRSRTTHRSSRPVRPDHTAPRGRWRTAKRMESQPSARGVRFTAAPVRPAGTRIDRYNGV